MGLMEATPNVATDLELGYPDHVLRSPAVHPNTDEVFARVIT